MGKKRSINPPVPDLIKIEVKDELGDSTVHMARDRFRGALRELLHPSDEDKSSADSDEDSQGEYRQPQKRIPRLTATQRKLIKRRRPMHLDSAFHHTYVMKLFDRSVDLAQFQEDTPLYPICRAWIANQPRNPNLVPKARSPSPETLEEVPVVTSENMYDDQGSIKDFPKLPPPLPNLEAYPRNRVPSPVLFEKEKLDLNYEGRELKSKETLLKDLCKHWTEVRKKWHKQAHKNEERFAESGKILSAIFKKAQAEFDT